MALPTPYPNPTRNLVSPDLLSLGRGDDAMGRPVNLFLSSHVLEHAADLCSLMTMLYSVLAPGGKLHPHTIEMADLPKCNSAVNTVKSPKIMPGTELQ